MAENLLRLYYARHAKVFLVERGTCWGDVITMIRSKHDEPTVTMQAGPSGELLVEKARKDCVRVRGTCVDTSKSIFPYTFVRQHSGVC